MLPRVSCPTVLSETRSHPWLSSKDLLGLSQTSIATSPVPSEAIVSASSFTLARPLTLLPSSSLPVLGPIESSDSASAEGGPPFSMEVGVSTLLAFCCINCKAASFMKRRYLEQSRADTMKQRTV